MALTYSAAKLPSGAALDPVTGVFTWTPAHANYGDNFVTFKVSNGLFMISQTVDFKVNLGMLKPDGYTKASYYLYQKEFERIQAASFYRVPIKRRLSRSSPWPKRRLCQQVLSLRRKLT